MHALTITKSRRQIGRSRITDYFWRCSCGEVTTAPNGFRTPADAWINSLVHRQFIGPVPNHSTDKETRSPMSQARHTAEALEAARQNTEAARHAASLHSHRAERGTLPQHISDLMDLVEAMATLHGVTADLATVAKTCADNVRTHYFHGHAPNGGEWPTPLKDAAGDADRALTKLRNHLNKTPAHAGHDTLSILHGFLRDLQRAKSGQQQ